MPLVTKRELRQLMHIHYVIELLLASAYVILKSIPWVAIRVFGTSEYMAVSTNVYASQKSTKCLKNPS